MRRACPSLKPPGADGCGCARALSLLDRLDVKTLEGARLGVHVLHARVERAAEFLPAYVCESGATERERERLLVGAPKVLAVLAHHLGDAVEACLGRLIEGGVAEKLSVARVGAQEPLGVGCGKTQHAA